MYTPDLELRKLLEKVGFRLPDPGPAEDWVETEFYMYKDGSSWFNLNVDIDGFMYYMIPLDVDIELTEALAYFMEYEWNGNLTGERWRRHGNHYEGEFSLAQFPAWYRFYVLKKDAEKEHEYKERPVDEDEIMQAIIYERLETAHKHPELETSQRLVGYLKEAWHRVSVEDEPVFSVNGTTSRFWFGGAGTSRPEIVHALRLLVDYASGGKGYEPQSSGTFHSSWRDYVSLYNKSRMWTIGVILHVCEKRIKIIQQTNIRLNREHQEKVEQYLKDHHPTFRTLKESRHEIIGGYGHNGDELAKFNGQRNFIRFKMWGDSYIIPADYPYLYEDVGQRDIFPVIKCSDDNWWSMSIPHAHGGLHCKTCQHDYDWSGLGYEGLDDHVDWLCINDRFDDAWDAYDEEWEEKADNIKNANVIAKTVSKLWPKSPELYDLEYVYPQPLVVHIPDNTVAYNYDDKTVYCPICHCALNFHAHVGLDPH